MDDLGYDWWPLPLAVRAALRRSVCTWGLALLNAELLVVMVSIFALLAAGEATRGSHAVRWQGVVVLLTLEFVLAFTYGATRESAVLQRRYRLVERSANIIQECANTRRAGGERKPEKLRFLSSMLRTFEREVMKAYRTRGTVPVVSPRRTELRRHAGLVVAHLRAIESELDGGHQQRALEELAGLVATIAEQYAAGHVGALLPPRGLEQYQPVRDRELLRVGTAVVLIAVASAGVSLLGLPDIALVAVIAAACVLTLLALFGSRWHRYLPLADLFKPGP